VTVTQILEAKITLVEDCSILCLPLLPPLRNTQPYIFVLGYLQQD